MLGNILEYHYGIVNHHTYCDGQRRERDDVYGTAGQEYIYKGHQQRDRNCQDYDECGTPPSEEEEHNKHYEDSCIHQRLGKIVNRALDELRGVHYFLDVNIRGQFLLQPGNFTVDIAADLNGVCA